MIGTRFLVAHSVGASGYEIEYWIIAGGGGSGRDDSFGTAFGGGGGGGVITSTATIPVGETLTATAIGAGGAYQSSSSLRGNQGNNTVFSSTTLGTLTAIGGGSGGGRSSAGTNRNGATGGSGGGGSGTGSAGSGTSGQGNNGAAGGGGNNAGGGGGYSAAGSGTNGGAGINLLAASTQMYAFGGAARSGSYPYSFGTNGDGSVGNSGRNTAGQDGEARRGSGGRWQGGGGNSGSVIVKVDSSISVSFSGTSFYTHGSYRYYQIHSTGGFIRLN